MAERRHGAKAATESTVSKESWDGRNVSGQEHTRVLFDDVDMTEVVNDAAVFTECTFRKVKLNCSSHTDAAFVNCTFSNCSFFDAKLSDCKLVGSTFERCNFELMVVNGGNWSHVSLADAKLDDASFENVKLAEADLSGARCVSGKLRDVDLRGAWVERADFTDCDLRGSDLGVLDPTVATLRGAIVTANQAVMLAVAMGLDVRVD